MKDAAHGKNIKAGQRGNQIASHRVRPASYVCPCTASPSWRVTSTHAPDTALHCIMDTAGVNPVAEGIEREEPKSLLTPGNGHM